MILSPLHKTNFSFSKKIGLCFFFLPFASITIIFLSAIVGSYPRDSLTSNLQEPLIFFDRNHDVLRRIATEDGRRYSWITLDRIPQTLLTSVITSEDKNFYSHLGIDPSGIVRAIYLNFLEQRWGYGGSTITMQLARMLHSRGEPRTFPNKLREAWYALRIERALSKKEIIEQYLNRAYFGRGAYGVEAASQLYFDKPVHMLSNAQALSMAVILRSPALYDPINHPKHNLRRRRHVIGLMLKNQLLTAEQIKRIESEELTFSVHPPEFRAPHFVDWILSQKENMFSSLNLDQGGKVLTTLDLDIQQKLERRVQDHVESMKPFGLNQAGAVILQGQTKAVIAMVGSADYNGPQGKLNITTWRTFPGSALKPFLYAIAIENGHSPSSIAWDTHDKHTKRLAPHTQKEHGPSRFRSALGGSFNLAAIRTLSTIGIPALIDRLRSTGAGKLPGAPDSYGLGLALGSTKVELLELANAYGFLVQQGKVSSIKPIQWVSRRPPSSLFDQVTELQLESPEQVFSKETSWLVMDMLSDPQPRRPVFGQELPLDLPFKVAAKTGTAQGLSSTVTIAVTNEYIVAAWAGNFDGSPTHGLVSMQTAAPIVRAGLELVSKNKPLTLPQKPSTIVEQKVCPLSGMLLSKHCPNQKLEKFSPANLPQKTCTWHQIQNGKLVIQYPENP